MGVEGMRSHSEGDLLTEKCEAMINGGAVISSGQQNDWIWNTNFYKNLSEKKVAEKKIKFIKKFWSFF